MIPAMTEREIRLFESFLAQSTTYLEFGSGGSTFLATRLVKQRVVSVDSSEKWLADVGAACAAAGHAVTPDLVFEDIGPVGDWGAPTDIASEDLWPNYYSGVWQKRPVDDTDLYLVDGRFRVACFASIVRRCRPDAVILIHDFDSRPHYHPVTTIARRIAGVDDLAVFVPADGRRASAVDALLERFGFDPA